MISSSILNERVTVMCPRTVRDSYGAQVTSYVRHGDVWANVKFLRGARALDYGDELHGAVIVVTTRLHACLTEFCHLCWDGKEYQIDSFNRSRADGSITMTCGRIDRGNPMAEASI